ncbi:MAG: DUF5667 domain-containing protein [Chloroflexota bacterium]
MDKRLLNEILAECLDAVESGRMSAAECLARYPDYRQPLEEALSAARMMRAAATIEPRAAFRRSARARLTARLPQRPAVTNRNPFRLVNQVRPLRFSRRTVMNWIAVFVLLGSLFGGGFAVQASSQALPDQALYPLKTGIEGVRLAFSGDSRRADLYLEFADRRLQEASQLAEQHAYEYLPGVVADYWKLTQQALGAVSYSPLMQTSGGAANNAERLAAQVDSMASLMEQLPADTAAQIELVIEDETEPPLPDYEEQPPVEGEEPVCYEGKAHPAGTKLAARYGVPYEDVMGWFCQGFGFGEIMLALEASQRTELTAEDLLLLKLELGGWGEVWKHLAMLEPDQPGETPTPTLTGQPVETLTPAPTEAVLTPSPTPTEDLARDGNYCANPTEQHPAGMKLAAEYGVTYEEVIGWFCQGYGMGEIMLALQTSQKTGLPAADLLAMKTELGGWGQVWQQLGLIGKGKRQATPDSSEVTPNPSPESTPDPTENAKPDGKPGNQPADKGKPDKENPGKQITPPGWNKPPKDNQPPANPGKGRP